MADNVTRVVPAGGTTEVLAANDIGGVKHPRQKTSLGPAGTAVDHIGADSATDAHTGAGVAAVHGMLWNGTTFERARSAKGSTDGTDGTAVAQVVPRLWNGSTYDRQRGNMEGNLLSLLARASVATVRSLTQTNHNARGVLVKVTVTARAAATTLQILIGEDLLGTGTVGRLTYGPALSLGANSIGYLLAYPGVVDGATGLAPAGIAIGNARSIALPRSWFVDIQPSDASSVTYQVDYSLIV